MQPSRKWLWVCLLATGNLGCQSLLYDLQPHRIRRLNRHPPPSMDPEFSSLDRAVRESASLAQAHDDSEITVVRAQSPAAN